MLVIEMCFSEDKVLIIETLLASWQGEINTVILSKRRFELHLTIEDKSTLIVRKTGEVNSDLLYY